ncbi:MAG: ABC transporter ATP-binding protein [Deltaproteobacteria bacterium]|nr:ABC transporter ATP-binding protein [Deltaproteobacteria bacterium]MBW2078884.1 ABC transporter ATP-binding protein [Deltaproteobacteria bacterium]MBW2311194.1 ABC transporter ATP-binding protein [Deltaproteobacteria bacterium]
MLEKILGKDIAAYVKAHRLLIAVAIILTALAAIFTVIPAYLLQPFIDEGMKGAADPVEWRIPWLSFHPPFSFERTDRVLVTGISPNRLLILLTGVAFLSILFKSITVYFSELSAAAFSNRAIRAVRIHLAEKFISLPLTFYHKRKSGELIARATADLTVMQGFISLILIGLVQQPLTAAVFLFYLLLMNFKLTVLTIIVTPFIVGLVRLFGRKVKKHSVRVQDATAEVTSSYQEIILLLKVIKGFCRGTYEAERFGKLADTLYKKVMHWNRWQLGIGPMMDVSVFLILPAVLLAGKIYFHHSLGEIIAILYAFARAYSPVKNLARLNNNLKTLQGATKRVFEIMHTVPDIQDKPGARDIPKLTHSIEFSHVDFGYEPTKPVLRDISFTANAGDMLAFVGSTGAGKSTLLDLIPRFYDVDSGSIRIDGMDIRDATLESLRGQIAIVSQESLLFHDTIANNINYNGGHYTQEDIENAAMVAHAHDFITALSRGYDTVVGDRGTLLSGGQRQRIAIARAVLKDPAILILDEPASALDPESERRIQEAIEKLCGQMTIFIVSHRLGTIRRADRIFVLENGSIVESGTHEKLMVENGRYKNLYDIQFRP